MKVWNNSLKISEGGSWTHQVLNFVVLTITTAKNQNVADVKSIKRLLHTFYTIEDHVDTHCLHNAHFSHIFHSIFTRLRPSRGHPAPSAKWVAQAERLMCVGHSRFDTYVSKRTWARGRIERGERGSERMGSMRRGAEGALSGTPMALEFC